VRAAEPSALVSLLDGADAIVVVDALLGGEPGEVRCLAPEELETQRLESLSTHGVGVVEAVALARLLTPEAVAPHVHIVGVCVAQAQRWVPGLSAPVAAAVPRAAALVRRLVTDGAAAADGA
jgi:hydrogenase maturation protease